jgi:putative transposase
MTKSRFSASQIMEVLKRADAGVKVPDIGRELGVSSATFYKWRPKHQRHTAKALCAWI